MIKMIKYCVNILLISYFQSSFSDPPDCVQYLSIRTDDSSLPPRKAPPQPYELLSFRPLIVSELLMRPEEYPKVDLLRSASHNLSLRINSAIRTNYIPNSKLFTDL